MKRNTIKVLSLFIIPILAISASVVAVTAFWKDSIKNDSAEVDQRLYTIEFNNNGVQYCDPYEGLEFNSGFEMPIIAVEGFEGWTVSSNGTGTVYIGYHTLNEFSSIINSANALTLYAKYSS